MVNVRPSVSVPKAFGTASAGMTIILTLWTDTNWNRVCHHNVGVMEFRSHGKL
jgi:hypothetical protein